MVINLGNCAIIRPEEVASHFASIPCSLNGDSHILAVVSLYNVSVAERTIPSSMILMCDL